MNQPTSQLICGDCVEEMRGMPEASVEAVVTDPPYGLEFMGKDWDKLDSGLPQEAVWKGRRGRGGSNIGDDRSKPGSRHRVSYGGKQHGFKRCRKCGRRQFSGTPCECKDPEWEVEYSQKPPSSSVRMQRWHEQWAVEVYRVLKPGGYLLAFGGTRTSHRLTCAIEDAGFEIRDSIHSICWIYGSGFPKSLDVGRATDMELCTLPGRHFMRKLPPEDKREPGDHVCPETPEGDEHRGEGTALKPAHEPIVVARKPLIGTVAQNTMKHGTGGINIDGCRVASGKDHADKCASVVGLESNRNGSCFGEWSGKREDSHNPAGRWPPNVVFTHHPSCKQIGTRKAKGYTINRWKDGAKPFGGGAGHPFESERMPDGEVEVWECVEGCPVKELDRQSGEKASRFFPIFSEASCQKKTHGDISINEMGAGIVNGEKREVEKYTANSKADGLGSKQMDQSRKDTKFTTSTKTRQTTNSQISPALQQNGMTTTTSDCGKTISGSMEKNIDAVNDAKSIGQSQISTDGAQERMGDTANHAPKKVAGNGSKKTESIILPIDEEGKQRGNLTDFPCFHYCAKASRSERDAGCEHLPLKTAGECTDRIDGSAGLTPRAGAGRSGGARNHHPTLKPIGLMRWLVRLVTPPGGTVLDPFAGSFTTGIAAYEEDCSYILIEKEPDYFEIGKARLAHARRQRKLF